MLQLLFAAFEDKRLMAMFFAAIAAGATVITLAMPFLSGDGLEKRMAAVATEREKIRQRERERLARGEKVSLRTSPKQYMQTVVEKFKLSDWVGQETVRAKLIEAGIRTGNLSGTLESLRDMVNPRVLPDDPFQVPCNR